MIPRNKLAAAGAVVLVGLLVAGAAWIVRDVFFAPKRITAYFTTATAIYPGDEVRVSGVKVGTIKSIQPDGTQAKMTLNVDRDVPIPADAKAVIVAQNLVAARYVQLTPAYRTSGPVMADGAVIPVDRTATPVEWDEVKTQLMRLATDLGPNSKVSTPSVARFIDSAANALQGNGDKLREALAQLSGVGRVLANGSGNIVDIIKNLQTFVTALRDSNTQIVQFNNRLATLTSVVNDSRSDLDAALTNLSTAVGEVQRFIAGTRDQTSEQIARLGRRHPDPRRQAHGAGERSARRSELARQLLQRLQPQHRKHRRGVRPDELRQSRRVGVAASAARARLRCDRRHREHHGDRNRQAVLAVPRPRVAGAQLQRLADPDQPVPAAGTRSVSRRLQRAAAGAGRRGG